MKDEGKNVENIKVYHQRVSEKEREKKHRSHEVKWSGGEKVQNDFYYLFPFPSV